MSNLKEVVFKIACEIKGECILAFKLCNDKWFQELETKSDLELEDIFKDIIEYTKPEQLVKFYDEYFNKIKVCVKIAAELIDALGWSNDLKFSKLIGQYKEILGK